MSSTSTAHEIKLEKVVGLGPCLNKSEVHWARVPPLCGKMKSTFSCAVEVDDI